MKKKTLFTAVVATLAIGLLASCGTDEKGSSDSVATNKEGRLSLSFGAMPAVDSLPLYIAEKEGFFKEEGLDLYLQAFKSPKDRDAALTSGNLDGANTDLIALSTYRQGDMDVKVVSQSIGTFSILTGNKDVKTLADLKGKKAGYAKNQAPYYFLDEALKRDGLSVDDLGFEEVPQIPVRIELVTNNKIDATIVPEPFRTIGMANGLTELANSNDLDSQSTVFGFTADSLNQNKKAIEAFYRGYDRGVDFINDNPLDEYYDVLKEKVGFSDDIKENVTLPPYTHAKQIDPSQLKNALDWSKEQGIYTKEWSEKDILSPLLTEK